MKLGIIPGYGGSQRLPRLVAKGLAMQHILAGEMITIPERFLPLVRAATKGVNCVGCIHAHYLQKPRPASQPRPDDPVHQHVIFSETTTAGLVG